jgi:hypothetical protein
MALQPLPYKESLLDAKSGLPSPAWLSFFKRTRIQFLSITTTTSPQSVNLAKQEADVLVIKDVSGTAATNPITVLGTVDGTVNPTISVNYGVLRLYADRGWWTW